MKGHKMERISIVEGSHAVFACKNCGEAKHSEIQFFHPMSKEDKQFVLDTIKRVVLT